MTDKELVHQELVKVLQQVIDPETGSNVHKMRLVQRLKVYEDGKVTYDFIPSSPLCPIALPLVLSIMDAVKVVEGVKYQRVTVKNYVGAEELNNILASLPASNSKL
jgi:metal-sulfur cluster biosynthetic enzyme